MTGNCQLNTRESGTPPPINVNPLTPHRYAVASRHVASPGPGDRERSGEGNQGSGGRCGLLRRAIWCGGWTELMAEIFRHDGSFEQVLRRAGEALRRRVRAFTSLISPTAKCCAGAEI